MNNPEGLMFTGTAVRAVAARVAASKVEKQQKQVADAELRRLAETTHGPVFGMYRDVSAGQNDHGECCILLP